MGIYLDNLASTPIDPRIVRVQAEAAAALIGNPNSVEHVHGVAAGEAIGEAARAVARCIGRDDLDLRFLPSASAALHIALHDVLGRVQGRKALIVATAVEHPSLLAHLDAAVRQGLADIELMPVDGEGQVKLEALSSALARGVDLVCAMGANNETGIVTPIAEVIARTRATGTATLVDASQSLGRLPMSEVRDADYVVASGSKIYGPRGSGVLSANLDRRTREMVGHMFGSPDAASAVAMAEAVRLRADEMEADEEAIGAMRDRLQSILIDNVPGLEVTGLRARRIPGALHVTSPFIPGDAVVARLWGQVSVSTGAACQSGSPGASHVIRSMGMTGARADGAVRIGIGRFNTPAEIELAGDLMVKALAATDAVRRVA